MKEVIKKNLDELYSLDPEFKSHEDELIKILEEVLKAKPDTKLDEVFVRKLRVQLMQYEIKSAPLFSWSSIVNNFNIHRYTYSGVLVVLILMVGAFAYWKGSNSPTRKILANLTFAPQTQEISANAFGKLAWGSGNNDRAMSAPAGMGGNSTGASIESIPKMVASDMLPLQMATYKFVYKGEDFNLENITPEVLRRDKGNQQSAFSRSAGSIDLGFLNLSKFSNLEVNNVNLTEAGSGGYTVNLNLSEGVASINRNIDYSSRANIRGPVHNEDLPSDAELIAIADKFLNDYNIDKSSYGAPEVNRPWLTEFKRSAYKDQAFLPTNVTILYPLNLNGRPVYEQGGQKTGLFISVDIIDKKVSDASNLSTQVYSSSKYELETNRERLLQFAEKGGVSYTNYEDDRDIKELELDTPTLAWVKKINFNGNTSEELYIPAYIFPIKNKPQDGTLWNDNIVVPLVKEMIDEWQKNPPLYRIMDSAMPMIK